MEPQRKAALWSVFAAVALIALKLGTGLATHSLGLISEAAHSGTDLIAAQAWLERVQRSQEQAALELDRREAELEARRSALTSAGQRRQVLDRLKERKREAHRVQSARREANALDEVATAAHIRRAAS